MLYLCTRNTTTGCSAVRLAHLVWDQRVPGSNPGIPTERDEKSSLFFCRATRIRSACCASADLSALGSVCEIVIVAAQLRLAIYRKKENYFPFCCAMRKTFVIFVLHNLIT